MCRWCDTRWKFRLLHPVVTLQERYRMARSAVHRLICHLTSHQYGVAYQVKGRPGLLVCHRCGGRYIEKESDADGRDG
jgi:hypothetical protein